MFCQKNKYNQFSASGCKCLVWGCLLLWVGWSAVSAETVIRCQLPDGQVSFSYLPCSSGVQDELEFEDQKVGWEAPRAPLKPEGKSKSERQQQLRRQAAALRAAKKEKERKQKDCWNKKQKIERIQERLRRGYKAGQGRTLHYKKRELEDYLREFCR